MSGRLIFANRHHWMDVLCLEQHEVTLARVGRLYRILAKQIHDDGGDQDALLELNLARDEALAWLRGRA